MSDANEGKEELCHEPSPLMPALTLSLTSEVFHKLETPTTAGTPALP